MTSIFTTPDGLQVHRRRTEMPYETALDGLAERLDGAKGAMFSSGFDYPGRYTRWAFGFIDPPVEFVGRGRILTVRAVNPRGRVILDLLAPILTAAPDLAAAERDGDELTLRVADPTRPFAEEERSLQPTVFTPLRALIAAFKGIDDGTLGLYGGFGYDLIFQFDPIELTQTRDERPDLHLYLADRMVLVDRRRETAHRLDYDFARGSTSTLGLDDAPIATLAPAPKPAPGPITTDTTPEEYCAHVLAARERIRVGDVFEVVLSRTFNAPYAAAPSALFHSLRKINPSPYEFYIQFGDEQLIGASPEMFVRVEGSRVESCPISGTARRTGDPIEDAERLKALINSEKDEVELTMCTDVDRNDKARICVPGTVKVIGRRQIEAYAGLYHTVDHVEGQMRPGLTGLDAFLTHMWAVTLTGAPKKMATRIIEQREAGPRRWYGGAIGALMLNGDVNTGITIRTVNLDGGIARYRTGATLVWDSVPEEEDEETRTKATSLFRALEGPRAAAPIVTMERTGEGRRVVLIDNEDSFVHTLADYFRQTGASVTTYRHGMAPAQVAALGADLVVHSPGPARPADFGVPELVRGLAELGVAQFGVCLGLQGMVEAFGGSLDVLAQPRHGKTWDVTHDGTGIFAGVPSPARVGAYHSLTARPGDFPHDALEVTARTEAGLVMAIRHRRLPIAAVQFHPESLLSFKDRAGARLIANVMRELARGQRARAAE